ncbi:MAG: RNA recognition motif domain-containing protein [Endomicrobiia bacterium]
MNIYVGNLPKDVNEEELRQQFIVYGDVSSCTIIKDKFTGESRGFGFVEMPSKEQAQNAISSLNGKEFKGKPITVNEARPKNNRNKRHSANKWVNNRRNNNRRFNMW